MEAVCSVNSYKLLHNYTLSPQAQLSSQKYLFKMEQNETEHQELSGSELGHLESEDDMVTSPQFNQDASQVINDTEMKTDTQLDRGELLDPESVDVELDVEEIASQNDTVMSEEEPTYDDQLRIDVELDIQETNVQDESILNVDESVAGLVSGSEDDEIVSVSDEVENVSEHGSVIELESEDEIENLEFEEEENAEVDESSDSGVDGEINVDPAAAGELAPPVIVEEEAQTEPVSSETLKIESITLQSNQPIETVTEVPAISLTEASYIRTPVYIMIQSDTYLLAPCQHQDEDDPESLISLFSWDEVLGCSLYELTQFFRLNDDLMDAYGFDTDDEIKLDFKELYLSVAEDDISAKNIKLIDVLQIFQKLSTNTSSLGDAPSKLTIAVSTQQRSITQFNHLQDICLKNGGFELLQPNHSNGDWLENGEIPTKKRKLQ
ncbi:hypothetical protein PUMCH_000973 [Australozyma saopauloensis]|uniref:Uncharacterized protein n=1 Tax=Australozyma saopauloensis TaxID=291208 RepID=A0AAX4H5G5_9ASCO|nr:hypothetical protein PUMCH_000973 [[Candida] saopauloensis]